MDQRQATVKDQPRPTRVMVGVERVGRDYYVYVDGLLSHVPTREMAIKFVVSKLEEIA